METILSAMKGILQTRRSSDWKQEHLSDFVGWMIRVLCAPLDLVGWRTAQLSFCIRLLQAKSHITSFQGCSKVRVRCGEMARIDVSGITRASIVVVVALWLCRYGILTSLNAVDRYELFNFLPCIVVRISKESPQGQAMMFAH